MLIWMAIHLSTWYFKENDMKYSDAYWFARGYYDARSVGVDNTEGVGAVGDRAISIYKQGYQCGIADYCELDIEGEQHD